MKSANDRHVQVECTVCFKKTRSDHLKRHMRKHRDLYSLAENDMREEIQERKRQYENRMEKIRMIKEIAQQEEAPLECIEEVEKTSPSETLETLEKEMLKDNQNYLEMIEHGKDIDTIIYKGIVREESLTKERKHSLDLYRKQRPRFDIASVELRIWQGQALSLIEKPTERQVIWIAGRQGNEGKSWFQNYVEGYFGFHRVFRSDLRIKHKDMCQVLKKRSLGSIDIFLFNDARSVNEEEFSLYRILEDIKDGHATTSKYDNDNIRFKTPNIVIIFSNHYPKLQKLSRDRWQIFNANKDGLNDVTLQVRKMKKDGYNIQNDDHLKKYM